MIRENPCQREQHGHMAIMTACMHLSRMLGTIWTVFRFLNGKGVHVCPKSNGIPVLLCPVKHALYSCFKDHLNLVRIALFELLQKIAFGFRFLISELRNSMKGLSVPGQFALILPGFCFPFHRYIPLEAKCGCAKNVIELSG